MDLRTISQLFTSRDIRNAFLGVLVLVGGLGLSALTLYAHRWEDPQWAAILAGLSLVSVVLILIFVVPPLARNAGREASQLNLPFEFTTGGAIYFILILVVAFSAWNTGNNLLFLVLSFMLSALVIGFFAGSICLKKLDIKMRFPETIFAGESTPILVGVTNRKRLVPAYSVIVEVRGKERERSIVAAEVDRILPPWIAKRLTSAPIVSRTLDHFEYVAPREEIEVKTLHVFPNRGRLLIRDFELSTKFPFGFFRHRRRLAAREAELIVFPEILDIDGNVSDVPTDAGMRSIGKRGTGQDLLALRDYRPYDDLRSIDWKATARTRNLTVREFAAEEEKNVTVVFDTRLPADAANDLTIREKMAAEQAGETVVESKRFEAGASFAASVLVRLTNESSNFRLILGDDAGDFGMGRQHLYDSLKRLSFARPEFIAAPTSTEPGDRVLRILDEAGDSHIFLITALDTDGLSPEIREQLNILGF